MSSIGSHNFIYVKGNTAGQQDRLEPFSRPGVDGESFQVIGTRAEVSTFTSFVDIPFASTAKNNLLAYENMVGTVVTVTDDHGNAYTNMLVIAVRQVRAKAVKTATGGFYTDPCGVQTCNWEFKKL